MPVRRFRVHHFARAAIVLLLADLMVPLVGAVAEPEYRHPLLAAALLVVVLNRAGGLYKPRLRVSVLDDLPMILGRQLTAIAVVVVAAALIGSAVHDTRRMVIELAGWFLLSTGVRASAYAGVRSLRRAGYVQHRALVVGGGEVARLLADTMFAHPEYGITPVGYVDDLPSLTAMPERLPHLGDIEDLSTIAARHDVQVLFFAFGVARELAFIDFLWSVEGVAYDLFVVPRLFEITQMTGASENLGAIPVIRIPRVRHRGLSTVLKRLFDMTVSGLALLLLSPLLLLCAAAVRTTGKDVVFRQRRVGRGGREFDLLKFRSMAPVADQVSATTWSAVGDARVTPVGALLRRTSLDELPQLWNIFCGQMTLVGPRPERPFFVDQFSIDQPRYHARHRVSVGLTGLAQVSGQRGGSTDIAVRSRYDNYYIEHWSLWGDIKVILRTVGEVVFARGG